MTTCRISDLAKCLNDCEAQEGQTGCSTSKVCVGLHEPIAQLGIYPVYIAEFVEDGLSETERGQGDFGSTRH